jgi:putative glutamine amidotransferase
MDLLKLLIYNWNGGVFMIKPLIGISGNILITQSGMFPGMERAFVNCDYVNSVIAGGGSPVILPVINDDEAIEAQMRNVDGLILSGGYDVDPLLYGEEPTQKQDFIYPEIDDHDIKLINAAFKMNKPILGICKGIQVLNVAFGGTLYQDLSHIEDCFIKHSQNSKRDMPGHTIEILKDTKLHKILGDSTRVNSFHHQAVKEIAPNFVANAWSKDGVVEGIEMQGDRFVLGVQWHPEGMFEKYPIMVKLFKAFVEATKF